MTSAKCKICKHPQREKIDEAIVAGKSIRDIVGEFGGVVSRESVRRHTKHVLAIVRKFDETQQLAMGGNLKAKIQIREADLLRLQQQAEKNGNVRDAIAAIRELRQCHELQARIEGQLKPAEVNVLAVNLDEQTSRRIAQTYLERHPQQKQLTNGDDEE
jgi:hypothetical protein